MAEMITRCPKCDTAFRITSAHLKSAKGSVRCGSCLYVFDAKDHLTTDSLSALNTEATNAPADHAEQQTLTTSTDFDDILISDDMDQEFSDEEPQNTPTEQLDLDDQVSLFEGTSGSSRSDDDDEVTEDESWALALLADEEASAATTNAEQIQPPSLDASDFNENYADTESVQHASDEAVQVDQEDVPKWAAYSVHRDHLEELNKEDVGDTEEFTPAGGRVSGKTYLDAIEPEPVEFAFRTRQSFWRARLLWGGLSLVAAVALAAQVAWLQFPTLSRVEPYRNLYAAACDLLNCQLPAQEDRSAIRTSNLVVRSHPRENNALMVDVVLQNTADFPQSFPVIELTFSNLESQVVAQRRFTPDEYLGGELTGQPTMPVRQPVHVAIAIVDPGREAVNYRIDIVDAQANTSG